MICFVVASKAKSEEVYTATIKSIMNSTISKHTINNIWLLLVLFMPVRMKAQQVKIGDDATKVKGQVEWLIRDYEQHKPIGSFRMTSRTKWSNGKIAEVDIERENVPHVGRNGEIKNLSFVTRYIMANGQLARILKEYYNLSLSELKQQQHSEHNDIGGYYFEPDYLTYATVFVGKNGLATLEIMQSNISKLPLNVKSVVIERRRKMQVEIIDGMGERGDSAEKDKLSQSEDSIDTFVYSHESFVDQPEPNYDFNEYIFKNLKYPKSARDQGITGRVIVRFIVNQDGTIGNIEITRSLDEECDEEVKRVIENMPKWKCGKKNNKPVRVSVVKPISFILN